MAAKKKKAAPRKHRRHGYTRRGSDYSPITQAWRIWCHDVDTFFHELVKAPSLQKAPPARIIARAEAFADAYRAMQDRRRPEGAEDGWR